MNVAGSGNKWINLARQYFAAVGDYFSFLTNHCCAANINCSLESYFMPPVVYNCFIYAQFALKSAFPTPSPGQIPLCSTSTPAYNASVNVTLANECVTILQQFVIGNGSVVPHCSGLAGEESSISTTTLDTPTVAEQSGMIIALLGIIVFFVLFQGMIRTWLVDNRTPPSSV